MGLGKTLTMIALVATDLEAEETRDPWQNARTHDIPHVKATLIVVPPPCISNPHHDCSWSELLTITSDRYLGTAIAGVRSKSSIENYH
jgi:hypothetical protein